METYQGYQLLTALCGTVLQAQIEGSSLAVLVVHEFITDATDKNKHLQNHKELEKLLDVLSCGTVIYVESGILYDGFCVDGTDFMLGKIVTNQFPHRIVVADTMCRSQQRSVL